jgi:SNF family Na+-dependent transporter
MNGGKSTEYKGRYEVIRSRQRIAILIALCCVAFLAVISKSPGLFFEVSKHWVIRLQVFTILLFVNFTAWNWRCPACRKYLGHDIARKNCTRCGAQLQ